MTDAARPAMPLSTRINHYFQHRSERERFVFEKVRQSLSLPTILSRRAAARELGTGAAFAIDRDVGFRIFPPGTFPEADEIVALTRGMGDNVDLNRPGLSKGERAGKRAGARSSIAFSRDPTNGSTPTSPLRGLARMAAPMAARKRFG